MEKFNEQIIPLGIIICPTLFVSALIVLGMIMPITKLVVLIITGLSLVGTFAIMRILNDIINAILD